MVLNVSAHAGSEDSGPGAPPPIVRNGSPNSTYTEELHERISALSGADIKPFFRLLRRQQRSLRQRLEEMNYTLAQSKDLRKSFERQESSLATDTETLMEAQRMNLARFKAMEKAIAQERALRDPQRVDAEPLQADLYAGVQFSSLYRDPEQSTSFFAKPRPFVALDIRQVYRWPGKDHWVEVFGTLSFQSSSKENSDTVQVITTSGNFKGETGLWWMSSLSENVSWGVLANAGLVGYTEPQTENGQTTTNRDEFRNRTHIGLTLRQEEGAFRGSVAEMGYTRDPLFLHQDRFMVRGRVVLTSFGSQGSSGDFYMEGFVSKGRAGRDEAVLMLGIRLSTLSFFRSLEGGSRE